MIDLLKIGNQTFSSRLILGTGKFPSPSLTQKAIQESACEIFTVAIRRVDLNSPQTLLLAELDLKEYTVMPNTAGAKSAKEAIHMAKLAKASGISSWIKVEITPESDYLLPDGEETLKACEVLVAEGFTVLPYILPDPILAKKLELLGVAAVMPLGSPIGTNQGIRSQELLSILIKLVNIPVIVDAGLGKPSDAALAMELGASAVLVNTAIATSEDPVGMACAFAQATSAGRLAYCSGIPRSTSHAAPSSPPLT